MAHFVSRSELFAGLVAAALLAIGSPAEAKKKKGDAVDPFDEPGLPTSGKAADSASQASDQERPIPIPDENAAGPDADEKGNVNFAGNRSGHGKIIVNAPPNEKAKVYLEGRYFGTAPRTINGIPPGDYIIEVTYPNGKSITKPVSVAGEEEAVIELGGAADVPAPVEKAMPPEQAEKRLRVAKMIGIGALGLLVVGGGLGIWEYTVQKDYDKTPPGTAMDNLGSKGENLALAANICFGVAALGLIGAGIIGYPAWKASKAERRSEAPDAPAPVSFMFGPGRTLGSVNAGMVYRF